MVTPRVIWYYLSFSSRLFFSPSFSIAGAPDVRRRRSVRGGKKRVAFARAGRRAPRKILRGVNRRVRPFQGRIRMGRQGVGATMTLGYFLFSLPIFYCFCCSRSCFRERHRKFHLRHGNTVLSAPRVEDTHEICIRGSMVIFTRFLGGTGRDRGTGPEIGREHSQEIGRRNSREWLEIRSGMRIVCTDILFHSRTIPFSWFYYRILVSWLRCRHLFHNKGINSKRVRMLMVMLPPSMYHKDRTAAQLTQSSKPHCIIIKNEKTLQL